MALAELKNKFLYEVAASEFPMNEVSMTELLLWELHYKEKRLNSNRK